MEREREIERERESERERALQYFCVKIQFSCPHIEVEFNTLVPRVK